MSEQQTEKRFCFVTQKNISQRINAFQTIFDIFFLYLKVSSLYKKGTWYYSPDRFIFFRLGRGSL